MTIRRFAVNKIPGDPGFVDELNAVLSELSRLSNSVLRMDLRVIQVAPGKSSAVPHGLGVVPDFVWGWESPADSLDVPFTVSEGERASWTTRTVRLTPNTDIQIVYLLIIALT